MSLDISKKYEGSAVLKMRKIQIKTANTVQETFDRFLPVKKAARLIDKTIDLDSLIPSYLCPEVSAGLRRQRFHPRKAVRRFRTGYNETLLVKLL